MLEPVEAIRALFIHRFGWSHLCGNDIPDLGFRRDAAREARRFVLKVKTHLIYHPEKLRSEITDTSKKSPTQTVVAETAMSSFIRGFFFEDVLKPPQQDSQRVQPPETLEDLYMLINTTTPLAKFVGTFDAAFASYHLTNAIDLGEATRKGSISPWIDERAQLAEVVSEVSEDINTSIKIYLENQNLASQAAQFLDRDPTGFRLADIIVSRLRRNVREGLIGTRDGLLLPRSELIGAELARDVYKYAYPLASG